MDKKLKPIVRWRSGKIVSTYVETFGLDQFLVLIWTRQATEQHV